MAPGGETKKMKTPTGDVERVRTQLKYIYNSYRTALLNRKYYGERLNFFQKANFWMEILIAVGAAGSSGIAGLAIWGTITGQYAWLGVSATATVLGVLKPIFQLGRHIEKCTNAHAGHTNVYFDLRAIVEDIEVSKALPPKLVEKYQSIRKRIINLGGLDDPKPRKNLIRKLQAEVNSEIPPESLWVPE